MGVVVITGAAGLLGRTYAHLVAETDEIHALGHGQLDISDHDAVAEMLHAIKPSVVVHCAAMTDVDACERDADRAWLVNAEGPGYVAAAAAEVGAEIVAISTDYVFDGEKGSYAETDPTNPIQEYGRAKLAGEQRVREANPRHYVVRSAWIYGPGGRNFLSKLPELAHSADTLKAIGDQRSSPTFAGDLAHAIKELAGSQRYGTYHVTNDGSCSYAEFASFAFGVLGAGQVEAVSHVDVPRLAPRPADTSLVGPGYAAAGFAPLRPWQDAARAFLTPLVSA
ncbi:MAG TPA: dTDP-4-dehydrorhamnose reductase [Actinomycetota bacterium]|nr:dTDP-4-dehydrorhamnose reductase [Actinomycetota bacterium]